MGVIAVLLLGTAGLLAVETGYVRVADMVRQQPWLDEGPAIPVSTSTRKAPAVQPVLETP